MWVPAAAGCHRDQGSTLAVASGVLAEGWEQVADLVADQRDQHVRDGVRGVFGGGEEGVREHGADGPPVPGGPGADLVLVEGGQTLGGLEVLLDSPPGAGHAHQRGQRHRPG